MSRKSRLIRTPSASEGTADRHGTSKPRSRVASRPLARPGNAATWARGALLLAALPLIALLPACTRAEAVENPDEMKVLVLGMDGLDPILLQQWMDEGVLPTFRKLAERGTFVPLGTAMPPQSPVAWSNFISGARPNTHEIWDFIHRKPRPEKQGGLPVTPYLSTSDVAPIILPWYKELFPESIKIGGVQIPLIATEQPVLLRRGPAFWDGLLANDIDTVIYRMPANYPPPEAHGAGRFQCLCGMGTPDLFGSYGEFTTFSTEVPRDTNVGGGRFVKVRVENNRAEAELEGPEDPFAIPDEKGKRPKMSLDVTFVIDPDEDALMIQVGQARTILRAGQWSDWLQISFDTSLPGKSVDAIVRAYVRTVRPGLHVYFSPLNIDPTNPVNPISTPKEFSTQIAEDCGLYYTTGIPEDTKALRSESRSRRTPQALNEDEFLEMVGNLRAERTAHYRRALDRFHSGFLFYYFGHTDQLAHIFWRDMDPGHPGRLPEQEGKYDDVIKDTYVEMDDRLAWALKVLDENDVIIAMSDHGFNSFRRGFNVNTWLHENGYQEWRGTSGRYISAGIGNLRFEKSQAYALGLNGLYINLAGRESCGIVQRQQYDALLHEIGEKLLRVRDVDGSQVIDRVYYIKEQFPDVNMEIAPDMLIGYARNYRGSWATALGGMSDDLLEDNLDRWSGDHCIAAHLVPGSLLTNLRVSATDPTLSDMGPSILALFGVEPLPGMVGRNIFEPGVIAMNQ